MLGVGVFRGLGFERNNNFLTLLSPCNTGCHCFLLHAFLPFGKFSVSHTFLLHNQRIAITHNSGHKHCRTTVTWVTANMAFLSLKGSRSPSSTHMSQIYTIGLLQPWSPQPWHSKDHGPPTHPQFLEPLTHSRFHRKQDLGVRGDKSCSQVQVFI